MTEEELKEEAEELSQNYFQQYGGFVCSWGNVTEIIKDMLKQQS